MDGKYFKITGIEYDPDTFKTRYVEVDTDYTKTHFYDRKQAYNFGQKLIKKGFYGFVLSEYESDSPIAKILKKNYYYTSLPYTPTTRANRLYITSGEVVSLCDTIATYAKADELAEEARVSCTVVYRLAKKLGRLPTLDELKNRKNGRPRKY